jgi:hypothetical protein
MSDSRQLLDHEIAKVQAELMMFRDECLPVFLGPHPDETPHSIRALEIEKSNQILPWYQAVTKLSEALPLPGTQIAALKAEDFKDFMFQGATPAFSISHGSIRWRIGLYASAEISLGLCRPPCMDLRDNDEDRMREFLAKLPQIKSWLMTLPVTDCMLSNAMCMVLPFLADVDPLFVGLALDPDTWRSIVISHPTASEDERQRRLGAIQHGYLRHGMNNALLHVLGSLANNHFMLVRDYLGHPCLYGNYTHLMPHYLFAVLFGKVSILRQLAAE